MKAKIVWSGEFDVRGKLRIHTMASKAMRCKRELWRIIWELGRPRGALWEVALYYEFRLDFTDCPLPRCDLLDAKLCGGNTPYILVKSLYVKSKLYMLK